MGDTWRLVTWSKDQTLRYWRVDSEIQSRCGLDQVPPAFQDDLFPSTVKCVSKKGSKSVSYTEEIVQSLTGRRDSLDTECPVQEQKDNEAILSEFDSLKCSKFQVVVASEDKAHLKVVITSNSKIKIRSVKAQKCSKGVVSRCYPI